jgi:hypothetical protein
LPFALKSAWVLRVARIKSLQNGIELLHLLRIAPIGYTDPKHKGRHSDIEPVHQRFQTMKQTGSVPDDLFYIKPRIFAPVAPVSALCVGSLIGRRIVMVCLSSFFA